MCISSLFPKGDAELIGLLVDDSTFIKSQNQLSEELKSRDLGGEITKVSDSYLQASSVRPPSPSARSFGSSHRPRSLSQQSRTNFRKMPAQPQSSVNDSKQTKRT